MIYQDPDGKRFWIENYDPLTMRPDLTPVEDDEEPAAPVMVPEAISMRQAELMLYGAGLLATVNAAIAAMPEPAQIEWKRASEVRRDNPLIGQVGSAVGLTEAQIDAMFVQAATL